MTIKTMKPGDRILVDPEFEGNGRKPETFVAVPSEEIPEEYWKENNSAYMVSVKGESGWLVHDTPPEYYLQNRAKRPFRGGGVYRGCKGALGLIHISYLETKNEWGDIHP